MLRRSVMVIEQLELVAPVSLEMQRDEACREKKNSKKDLNNKTARGGGRVKTKDKKDTP